MEHLPAGMRKEEGAVLSPEAVCVLGSSGRAGPRRVAVSGLWLCVLLCAPAPFSNKQPGNFP